MKALLNPINLHNELPERLGNIADIKDSEVPKINQESLAKLTTQALNDLTGKTGFINKYFSDKNIRYRSIVQSGDILDSSKGLSQLLDLPGNEMSLIPFTPLIAVSGGPDSGLAARLCIEAYLNRARSQKTELDTIFLVTFTSKRFNSTDCARAKTYIKYLETEFGNKVPIRSFVLEYPENEIEAFVSTITAGYELMHGKIQNLNESLTNAIISVPSEETGFHSSVDSTNLSEFLLDEVTNGSNGGTNFALFSAIPKTVVFSLCDHMGISDLLESENSTTWENKAESYLQGAQKENYKEVFHAIDTVHYLAIIEQLSIDEIVTVTHYKPTFVRNVLARMINNAKRRHVGGQEFIGDLSHLEPKNMDYFSGMYAQPYLRLLKSCLGVDDKI